MHETRICLGLSLHACPRTTNAWAHLPSCVSSLLPAPVPFRSTNGHPLAVSGLGLARTRRYRNINRLCIDYAFRPRLSSRLTLGGLALPRNPWASGGGVSHPSLATHTRIRTRTRSTVGLHHRFTACSTLPYRSRPLFLHPICHRAYKDTGETRTRSFGS